jgi:hypothetical protein
MGASSRVLSAAAVGLGLVVGAVGVGVGVVTVLKVVRMPRWCRGRSSSVWSSVWVVSGPVILGSISEPERAAIRAR